MKKICLLLAISFASLVCNAEDFKSMKFVTNSGSESLISLENLEMSFSDGNLVVKNNSVTTTFALSNLKSMEFSSNIASGVAEISTENNESLVIYTLQGACLGKYVMEELNNSSLAKGVYVGVKQSGETIKVLVK